MKLYYLAAEYYATGEGVSYMFLVTYAMPHLDDYSTPSTFVDDKYVLGTLKNTDEERAMREFSRYFDPYYARGAVFYEKEEFLKKFQAFLPVAVTNYINKPEGNFHWYQSYHLNLS